MPERDRQQETGKAQITSSAREITASTQPR